MMSHDCARPFTKRPTYRAAELLLAVSAVCLYGDTSVFNVDSTATNVDINPGDGVCDDGTGHCTLRAAIMESNALSGAHTINLAAGAAYTLTSPDNAACIFGSSSGLPSIESKITINGNGATIMRSSEPATPEFRIFCVDSPGDLTLMDVTLRGGATGGGGGALFNQGATTVVRSTITGNRGGDTSPGAPGGGGIFNSNGGNLTILNSTITGNTGISGYGGGGIFTFNGATTTISNSTIAENIADGPPGFQGRGDAIAGSATVKNSILASPVKGLGDDCYAAAVTSLGNNIASDNSCALNGPGDQNNTDPMLSPLAINGGRTMTQALLAGSPAIDAVLDCTDATGAAVSTDQRGIARPQGAACDIGAFELGTAQTGLTITKTHTGNFTQGQPIANFLITVTNAGTTPTVGTVTVTDDLSEAPGLTVVNFAGFTDTKWVCISSPLRCTRSDPLDAGASYDPIQLTVSVAPDASSPQVNHASVSGGAVTNFSNFSAGFTYDGGGGKTIGDGALQGNDGTALAVPFVAGSTAFLDSIVMGATHCGNGSYCGGSPPRDLNTNAVIMSLYDDGATGGGNLLESITVTGQMLPWTTRADAIVAGTSVSHPQLVAGQTYWLVATVPNMLTDATNWLASTNKPPQQFTYSKVGSGAWAFEGSLALAFQINGVQSLDSGIIATATDSVTIAAPADLTITKSHSGNFTQGDTGRTYTITVSNVGASPSVGAVTAADTLPAGLTPAAASGTGWTCGIVAQTASCTRGDSLAGGASYPAISLTVNVAIGAAASVTNTASVSGGGDISTANNSASDPTTILPKEPVPTACVAAPAGMIAWYPLDETSSPAHDIAAGGGGANATWIGNPIPVGGMVGKALSFGANQYVESTNAAEGDIGTGDFSIDAWVQASPSPGVTTFVDKRDLAAGVRGYAFYLFNGNLGFQLADRSTASASCSSNPASSGCTNWGTSALVADGKYHLVAATVSRGNNTGGKLYVDGNLVLTFDPTIRSLTLSNSAPLQIGGGRGNAFLGNVDEVEIFNRALGPSEVQLLYAAGSFGKCKSTPPANVVTTVQANNPFLVGLNITVDGVTWAGHAQYSAPAGSTHTHSTTTPQILLGSYYQFQNWTTIPATTSSTSLTQTVTLPSINSVYIANFNKTGYVISQYGCPVTISSTAVALSASPLVYPPNASITINSSLPLVKLLLNGVWTSYTSFPATFTLSGPASISAPCAVAPPAACLAPPPAGMVGWWGFEPTGAGAVTGSITDLSGNANHGTLVNGVTQAGGKVQSFLSSGSTYLQVPSSNSLNFGTGAFSGDLWVRWSDPSVNTVDNFLLDKFTGSSHGFQVALTRSVESPGVAKLMLRIFDGSVFGAMAEWDTVPPALPSDGLWHLVAFSYDPAKLLDNRATFYVDGALIPTQAFNTANTASLSQTVALNVSGSAPLTVGKYPGLPTDFAFNGGIDEVELFNRAITAADLQPLIAADSLGKCKTSQTPVTLTVATSPTGLQARIGTSGAYAAAPISQQVAANQMQTISVQDPQFSNGTGYSFTGWSTGASTAVTTVQPASDFTATANFKVACYALTVNVQPAASGSVSANPQAGGIAGLPQNCYAPGTTVTLTATGNAAQDFIFLGSWSGAGTGGSTTRTVVMNGPSTVTANFSPYPAPNLPFGGANWGYASGSTYQITGKLGNNGADYNNIKITQVVWTAAAGAGAITDTTALPIAIGNLAGGVGALSSSLTFNATMPTTVTQFKVCVSGTADSPLSGKTVAWTDNQNCNHAFPRN